MRSSNISRFAVQKKAGWGDTCVQGAHGHRTEVEPRSKDKTRHQQGSFHPQTTCSTRSWIQIRQTKSGGYFVGPCIPFELRMRGRACKIAKTLFPKAGTQKAVLDVHSEDPTPLFPFNKTLIYKDFFQLHKGPRNQRGHDRKNPKVRSGRFA